MYTDKLSNSVMQLYESKIDSTRSGAFYNSFPYPTKISPESIALFIATHTKPGDCIIDPFGGSGSTGIATLLCSKPTEKMINLAKQLKISPVWGRRNAVVVELSTFASFAANVMCNPPDAEGFLSIANDFVKKADEIFGHQYSVVDDQGDEGYIRHVIWTDVLKCTNCNKTSTFVEVMIENNPLRMRKIGKCPHCGAEIKDNFSPVFEQYYDSLLKKNI